MKWLLSLFLSLFCLTAYAGSGATYSIHARDVERNKMVVRITEGQVQTFYFMVNIQCRIDGYEEKGYGLERAVTIDTRRNTKPNKQIQSEYLDPNIRYTPSIYIASQDTHQGLLANAYDVYCNYKVEALRKLKGDFAVFDRFFLSNKK